MRPDYRVPVGLSCLRRRAPCHTSLAHGLRLAAGAQALACIASPRPPVRPLRCNQRVLGPRVRHQPGAAICTAVASHFVAPQRMLSCPLPTRNARASRWQPPGASPSSISPAREPPENCRSIKCASSASSGAPSAALTALSIGPAATHHHCCVLHSLLYWNFAEGALRGQEGGPDRGIGVDGLHRGAVGLQLRQRLGLALRLARRLVVEHPPLGHVL